MGTACTPVTHHPLYLFLPSPICSHQVINSDPERYGAQKMGEGGSWSEVWTQRGAWHTYIASGLWVRASNPFLFACFFLRFFSFFLRVF